VRLRERMCLETCLLLLPPRHKCPFYATPSTATSPTTLKSPSLASRRQKYVRRASKPSSTPPPPSRIRMLYAPSVAEVLVPWCRLKNRGSTESTRTHLIQYGNLHMRFPFCPTRGAYMIRLLPPSCITLIQRQRRPHYSLSNAPISRLHTDINSSNSNRRRTFRSSCHTET